MKKNTVFFAFFFCLLAPFLLLAEGQDVKDLSVMEKLAFDFERSFLKDLEKKSHLYSRDACTEEEKVNTYWKCEDNTSFRSFQSGKEYSLHERQRDQFTYTLVKAQVAALKETPWGAALDRFIEEDIKPFFRFKITHEITGHTRVLVPGMREREESDWDITISPKFAELDSSFGYDLGLNIEASFYENFSMGANWEREEDKFGFSLSYQISPDQQMTFLATTDDDKVFFAYSFNF